MRANAVSGHPGEQDRCVADREPDRPIVGPLLFLGTLVTWSLLDELTSATGRRAELAWPETVRAQGILASLQASGVRVDIDQEWAHRFGLDEIDLRLLEIAAAAELSPPAHLLLSMLAGDKVPALPTVALALELADCDPADPELQLQVTSWSPLVRYGLLSIEGNDALGTRRLRLPDRVADQLRGSDLPAPDITSLLTESVPVRTVGTDRLASAMAWGEKFVWVHAPVGSAAGSMVAAACRMNGTPPIAADLRRIPVQGQDIEADTARPDPQRVTAVVRQLVLEANLAGAPLVLVNGEIALPALPDLQRTCAVPVVLISHRRWDPVLSSRLPYLSEASRLSVEERDALWDRLLPGLQVSREVAALRLDPDQMVEVGRDATRSAHLDNVPTPSTAHLQSAARRFGRGRHSGGPGVGLEDLVLPAYPRSEVARLLGWARYRDEVLAQGPVQGKGGKGTGICALFAGGPGTGKTLAAHVVADSLGMDLMQVDLSAVVSKYIGESEKNLEKVFTEAETLNAVLFFDEADSLFGSRSTVKDAHDKYANQETAYLLQRMESFDGLTILATNLRGNLDPAFARRLHFIITFPDPDAETRARLWAGHLAVVAALDPQDPIDTDALGVGVELAGGDIRNVVLSATYDAVAEGEHLGMRHLAAALTREFGKLGRRVSSLGWYGKPVGQHLSQSQQPPVRATSGRSQS